MIPGSPIWFVFKTVKMICYLKIISYIPNKIYLENFFVTSYKQMQIELKKDSMWNQS